MLPYNKSLHGAAGATVETLEKDRFTMKYAVISHKLKKTPALGEGVIVTFDYQNNKKTPVPDGIRKRIIALEKGLIPNVL